MKPKTIIIFILTLVIFGCGKVDEPEDLTLKEIELMQREEELRKKEEELVKRELEVLKWETQNDTSKIETTVKDTTKKEEDISETNLTYDQRIERIKKEYQNINNNSNRFSKKTKELSGFSTEGGELDIYSSGKEIRKLSAMLYGETGKRLEEYYYKNNELIFAYSKSFQYDKPFGNVIETEENKFYISDNKLIKWTENNETISANSPDFSSAQNEINSDSKMYLKLAKE